MSFLNSFIPVARMVSKIYAPFVDVIIHDLDTQKIHHIEGAMSKLKQGELSRLEEKLDLIEASMDRCSSSQIDINGGLIKTISTILFDTEGQERGLMCIHFDVSKLMLTHEMLTELLMPVSETEGDDLFKNDWQDQIHLFIHKYLDENNFDLNSMNKKQKKQLVQRLFYQGAFDATNSTNYIANLLKIGRATIFNYLKEWRASIAN